MTFIATVVSQKGAAIIADSLTTAIEDVIDTDDIIRYFEALEEGQTIDPDAIINLSKRKPNYTKNYAEKLFKYDKYTAITTAGAAYINEKVIEDLVQEHVTQKRVVDTTSSNDLNDIVESFALFLREEAEQHLQKRSYIDTTVFYFTHYNPTLNETRIVKVTVGPMDAEEYAEESNKPNLVSVNNIPQNQYVVCDGQNSRTDRILFGDLRPMFSTAGRVIELVYQDLGQPVPADYIENFFNTHNVLSDEELRESMTILKLRSLSLQQAVNLAALLMRIERDLQSYTENIPTVGGLIKMAVIDKEGFHMIMGNDIETPMI